MRSRYQGINGARKTVTARSEKEENRKKEKKRMSAKGEEKRGLRRAA